MNKHKPTLMHFIVLIPLLISATALVLLVRKTRADVPATHVKTSPCKLALIKHSGTTRLDQQIVLTQQQLGSTTNSIPRVEQLGWLFIKKARESYDPGYYKLAEQCAACIETSNPNSQEALLLRAHVLHSLHHFEEAETLARKLATTRGLAFDYGVLGDILVDVGKVDEAADAYQRMMDQRPDLQSYTRAAHLNWIVGRLPGALRLMQMATDAASPADAESAAWAFSRLALYQFQAGDFKKSLSTCNQALSFIKDYAPALLVRGRILLSQNKAEAALADLRQAASLNQLPEYQWYLADALRVSGRESEARDVERGLISSGASNDPRTLSIYLSSRNQQTDLALVLARQELKVRQDIFTYDALAWALAANGQLAEAREELKQALKHKTVDARLSLHAGVIAIKLADKQQARKQLMQAKAYEQMLAPSERELLAKYLQTL